MGFHDRTLESVDSRPDTEIGNRGKVFRTTFPRDADEVHPESRKELAIEWDIQCRHADGSAHFLPFLDLSERLVIVSKQSIRRLNPAIHKRLSYPRATDTIAIQIEAF